MPTSPTTITALPAAPDPNDRSTFNTRAYPWSAALVTWTTQTNNVATVTYNNAVEAAASAALATAQANAAIAVANAIAWVSGTTYAVGDVRYSPASLLTYRRTTNGAGTVDPSLDTVNWVNLSGQSLAQIQATALCF